MWSGLKTNRAALLILNAVRVRITPQPALAGLGGCHHRMPVLCQCAVACLLGEESQQWVRPQV